MEPRVVIAKWLNKTVPFEMMADFVPIAIVATSPLVLFAHRSAPVHDIKELIAYSKAYPGKLSVGTPGIGTPHHLAAAWLNTAAKIAIGHVPYRKTQRPVGLTDSAHLGLVGCHHAIRRTRQGGNVGRIDPATRADVAASTDDPGKVCRNLRRRTGSATLRR